MAARDIAPVVVPVRRPPPPAAARVLIAAALLLAAVASVHVLDLEPSEIWPTGGGWQLTVEFFSHAVRPALSYEDPTVPVGTRPLAVQALAAAWRTVAFAAAAMVPSLLLGLGLGFGGSTAWWAGDRGRARRAVGPAVSGACRLIAVALRSLHELMWAVLLLAALGITPLAALLALALPYGGILGKIFAEIIDEAPRDAGAALREAGAGPVAVFLFGLLPRAWPDMTAYTLYRFECALRSAAVLGFFGFPTLGYFIAASFENLHHGEVWTYLYVLVVLVVAVEWWSSAVRRRLAT